MTASAPRHTNRLALSTSPYLLQHAHNPVDWYPWGEEALSRAREEGKPILLSIGYSACHWCHVMERESFEDEGIARLMNEHFVPIKVDREERPDLDDIYMAATLAMNQGQGGWPMTVFLTPEQEPFFAGTYFPPTDRYGRPGFRTVLERLAGLWATDQASVRAQGAELARFLKENARAAPGPSVGEDALRAAAAQLRRDFDARWGGFGRAPKFPPSMALMLLLRAHRRFGDAGDLEIVRVTLDRMARGGMYDQVGGGFHRYSVDERWLVPHFEKMLYDNALLVRAYLEGWQATGDPSFRRIATEVLDYVRREMTSPEGGFYSATDADSEGEEGKFFVWSPAQVAEAVGVPEDARLFCAAYDVSEGGNFEGRSIPNLPRPLAEVARELDVPLLELEAALVRARPKLLAARARRVAPGLDDKVLTAWNGLMISAFAEAHRVLGETAYLEAAVSAAEFLRARLRAPDGRLWRTYRNGTAHLAAYLEDYAFLAAGLLDLYESGGDDRWLEDAEALAERLRADFQADDGGFFATARDHESLIIRPREGHDGAIPAANAVAAQVLARLSHHLDRQDLRDGAVRALSAWGKAIARQPRAFATSLMVVDFLLDGPVELALVGERGARDLEALRAEVGRRFVPSRIVAVHDVRQGESRRPLLAGKTTVGGKAALYVCRDFACGRPVTDPAGVEAALAAAPGPAPGAPRTVGAARLAGHATPEATAAAAARAPAGAFAPLGSTGLAVSRLGFGGYRVDDETEEHRRALVQALASGVNVVDTSTNYMDGGSERLAGEVLAERSGAGHPRAATLVVTKIGYVQGQNLEIAEAREREGRPFPEVVKYGEGIWHCVHPEFLQDQLARSLDRLHLAAVDVLLLHNPEYFLMDAHERSHGGLEKRRAEFYGRLEKAFAFLEDEVRRGTIRGYGVSSNTCTRRATDPEATSLTAMLAAAEAAGGPGHHFRVLQLPLNLVESGAVRERNCGPDLRRTVLEEAQARGVGVLVNRPLNAMAGDGLVRLATVDVPGEAAPLEPLLEALEELEGEYRRDVAAHLQTSPGGLAPVDFFRWGSELRGAERQVRTLEHWDAVESQRILPRLTRTVQALDEGLGGEMATRWHAWRGRYLPALTRALQELRRRAAERSHAQERRLAAVVDPLLPPERRGETLSRKALWVVASTPGVSTVLVGMRRTGYVDDATAILSWPPLADAARVYEAVAAMGWEE
jgi:uncharacterized protein YyaL (SSP411 family)/aryl-alcohol dehydrogenase-like predicted oxidoreductase